MGYQQSSYGSYATLEVCLDWAWSLGTDFTITEHIQVFLSTRAALVAPKCAHWAQGYEHVTWAMLRSWKDVMVWLVRDLLSVHVAPKNTLYYRSGQTMWKVPSCLLRAFLLGCIRCVTYIHVMPFCSLPSSTSTIYSTSMALIATSLFKMASTGMPCISSLSACM